MRTPFEIYQDEVRFEWTTVSTDLKESILEAIKQAQIEAYNEAIEDVKKNHVINEGQCGEFGEYQAPFLELDSIDKLKK